MNYSRLEALYWVTRLSSFARAAAHLRVSQSAVSQRISTLEEEEGIPLLVRATPPRPTKIGIKYISAFEQMSALMWNLSDQKKKRGLEIKLPIACNVENYECWFNKCEIDASKKLGILFDTLLEDQSKTHIALKDGRVFGCISSDPGPFQGCTSVFLGTIEYICVAHHSLATEGILKKNRKKKILEFPTVIFGPNDDIHDEFLKQLFNANKAPRYKSHTVPSILGMLNHVEAQTAYAVLPKFLVGKKLKTGVLENLFPEKSVRIKHYWHRIDSKLPVLDEFSKMVVSSAEKHLLSSC